MMWSVFTSPRYVPVFYPVGYEAGYIGACGGRAGGGLALVPQVGVAIGLAFLGQRLLPAGFKDDEEGEDVLDSGRTEDFCPANPEGQEFVETSDGKTDFLHGAEVLETLLPEDDVDVEREIIGMLQEEQPTEEKKGKKGKKIKRKKNR